MVKSANFKNTKLLHENSNQLAMLADSRNNGFGYSYLHEIALRQLMPLNPDTTDTAF
jgi:hypothetical protein